MFAVDHPYNIKYVRVAGFCVETQTQNLPHKRVQVLPTQV